MTRITFNRLNRVSAILACVLFLSSLTFQPAMGQHRPRKRLAVISAYHESAPWAHDLLNTLTINLSKRSDILIDPVYMNTTLITDTMLYNRTVDGVFRHFQKHRPDYAVLFGGMGITLRDRIREEWGDIPFIFVSRTDRFGSPDYYITGDTLRFPLEKLSPIEELRGRYNFTFIENPDLVGATIEMMLRMQPEIRKLVVLADASYHNRHMALDAKEYISRKYPGIEYEWLISKDENLPALQSLLTNYNPEIGLLLCSWFYGRRGTLGNREILAGGLGLIPAVEQPVFSLREYYLREGAVGGYFPSSTQTKECLLSAVLQMIDGTPVQQIPFVFGKDLDSSPIVDYSLLESNHLSERLCPEDTVFINRPLSFWDRYKWPCIVTVMGLLVAVFIITFRISFQRRRLKDLQRYDTLLSNMPIGYTQGRIIFTGNGSVADLEYHSGNQSFLNLLERDAIPGKPGKLFPEPYIAAHVTRLLKDRQPILFTYHFRRTDHFFSFMLCLVNKEPGEGFIQRNKTSDVDLFAIDVTDRSRAERDIHKITEKLKLTLRLTRIIPWYWNFDKGEIVCDTSSILPDTGNRHRDNSSFQTVLREDDFFNRVHPDDRNKVRSCYADLVSGESTYIKTEFRTYGNAGSRKKTEWFEINAIVTETDEGGRPLALSGSLLLITERKRQEQALIEAREQAKESDRMKSAFLANMSHEIRTPLNAIVGFSGLLSKTEDPAKKQKFVELIESNNNLLLQLISDVLDLAKVESNTLEFSYQTVDLNELMNTIEQSIRFKVKPGVELRCSTGADRCVIKTEPNRLAQLVNNLLTNACKFTVRGSIDFGYEIQGNSLYFFVKDTGIGISFENQQKLFQRFSKLNNFAQGTGLGLSICKGIVEKMGGCIGMVSDGEGCGSKFWFTIPFTPAGEHAEEGFPQRKASPEETSVRPEGATVLVAEDNESNFMLFQSILESDYRLLHAWDGEEAVAMYKEHRPDAILMDIGMPKMDGYEAAREIRKVSDSVPIIAVTAYAFASDKTRILSNGFNSYVSKPINADILLRELESVLGKRGIQPHEKTNDNE
ncbi:MAG: response regulator [Bacteroides sp.]|nr:response regulator [Ruminococcus flavefaciens]MCM1554462.1 response regulator [Bacteroides sp.]